jgi:hypothetical protein
VWGRTRLPSDCSNIRDRHRLEVKDYWDKARLPEAHTCFFYTDVPEYDRFETMCDKFKYAMETCGEIDGDYYVQGVMDDMEDE